MTRIAVDALALQDIAHLDRQPLAQADVEVGEGLVEQDQFRPGRQGASQRDPLLLAAGELVRVLVALAMQADRCQQLAHPQVGIFSPGLRPRPKATFCSTVRCGNSA